MKEEKRRKRDTQRRIERTKKDFDICAGPKIRRDNGGEAGKKEKRDGGCYLGRRKRRKKEGKIHTQRRSQTSGINSKLLRYRQNSEGRVVFLDFRNSTPPNLRAHKK